MFAMKITAFSTNCCEALQIPDIYDPGALKNTEILRQPDIKLNID